MNFSLSRFSCLILLVSSFLCGCSKSIGVTGVRLSESSVTLKVGESTSISAVVEPSDADYEMIKWSSSDPFVASVEDGVIRANKVGTTKVTASAGGVTSAPCNVTVDIIHVQEVSLNVSAAEMTEGEELTLYSAVFPSNAANPKVFWSSSDEKVASVSDQGVVRAVSAGIARITVTSEDMGLTATCQVTVKQKVVEVSGVTLSSEEVALKEGEKCTLVVTVSPVNATDKTVTWSSSDESVVTVDPTTGEITAVSSGEAVVLCTAGGGTKTASCRVTVAPSGIPVTGITVSPESITLALGEKASLKARITPADATDKEVIWSSSNESVVSVDPASGEITAKAIGMAVVTCTTADGSKAASCSVTVATKVPVTQVMLSTNSLFLSVGQTHELSARVLPENAANKEVAWRSNNTAVATVSSSGVVTARGTGIAIVSAISEDGGKSASCRVTVSASSVAVTGVTLDRSSVNMAIGSSMTLNATVSPSNATDQKLTWISSTPSVATVSQNGVVEALRTGSAVITVRTADGAKTATCRVTVASNPSFSLTPRRDASESGENVFRYNADGDFLMTTVQEMNLVVYQKMGLSKNDFHSTYDLLAAVSGVGSVSDNIVNYNHLIRWTLSEEELINHSGETISVIARYIDSKNTNRFVDITLTATVADRVVAISLSPSKGDYIRTYWTEGYSAAKYNVNVPRQGESSPDNCQFQSDINAPFTTYPKGSSDAGKIQIDGIDQMEYYFCKDMTKITRIGNLNVKFNVSDEGDYQYLWATVNGKSDKVATICNTPTEIYTYTVWNMFTFNKESEVACQLLNTGEMYVFIGANAHMKSGETLYVIFDGMDHFRANILRPVYCSSIASDRFISGVGFGEKGSYLPVEDVVSIVDWRMMRFHDYPFYYGYYGPVEIVIDMQNVQCDLNGTRQSLPQDIILLQTGPGATSINDPVSGAEVALPGNERGYLMCKVGEAITSSFNIYVKAMVKYGFGELTTDWITIPVHTSN